MEKHETLSGYISDLERALLKGDMEKAVQTEAAMLAFHMVTVEAARIEGMGIVPDRECFWLVERNVSPPQYVSHNSAGWHEDPWQARRFNTEREAHDYWRLMGEIDRPQFKVIEHMFLNKVRSTPEQLLETSRFMCENGL